MDRQGQQLIIVDKPADSGHVGGIKINDNFTDLYATSAQVKYTSITAEATLINDSDLILGHNIFGVNYTEEEAVVMIALQANIASNKLVIIKDESGNASVKNIRVSTRVLLPPIDFRIDSVTSTTATVAWTPPERGGAIGYLVYVNGVPTVNTGWEIGSSVVVPGLSAGTPYAMHMATYDADFISEISNQDTATTTA